MYTALRLFFATVVFIISCGCVYQLLNLKRRRNQKNRLYSFIECMPKVELHVHLEGSIKPETLFTLAKRNGVNLPVNTHGLFTFKDFANFVEIYRLVISCLKTVEDYELVSYEFGRECARQNIKYAEVTFSLATNCQLTGLSWQQILEGLNKGRLRAQHDFDVTWNWIFDILRERPDTQIFVLDAALASKNQGVIGVGLSGREDSVDSKNFIKIFQKAHQENLAVVPHAGEAAGSQSVWDVIKNLHADRIGHGVRSIEDPLLVAFLAQQKIPLEICLTSNILIGIYSSFKAHPLRQLWDAGVYITINSDDPALFNTDLNNEYKVLVNYFDFKADDLEKISLNSVRASFLPDSQKRLLVKSFESAFKKLRATLEL